MDNDYMPRLFDSIIEFSLKSRGAILIVGPKWCGKSKTAKQFAATTIDFLKKSDRDQFIPLAKNAPNELLNIGPKPILIDEWQVISFIWNTLKEEIDSTGEFGQFILTGSVTDKLTSNELLGGENERHTGTGRIIKKMMRTFSLYESNDSNGSISLNDLKNGIFKVSTCKLTINDYAFLLCRGGWPLSINKEKDVALQQAIDFYEGTVTDDIFSIKDIPLEKDITKARKLMRSYARNISTECPDSTLIKDISNNNETFNERTFNKYMRALNQLYIIEELEAWNPNLRSKTAIREKPTRHFVDPSIACASLGITPTSLFKDIKTFGLLFESLVVRDLRIYCDHIKAHLYHYRDKMDREADAVIQFDDGNWALIEVKLSDQEEIDKAANKLIALSKDIDEENKKPSFLAVITTTSLAYQREDGVYVIPLGCLKN